MNKAKLLIVDDEEINLEILNEHLRHDGYETVSATDGIEAWEILQENPAQFDAVLLDRMMPRMDGIELLEKVKADSRMSLLPVIMQTAKTSNDEIQEGLNAGCYYYLTKPFDGRHLTAIVASAVRDFQQYRRLKDSSDNTVSTLGLLNSGEFQFRTLNEARDLASLISNACPNGATIGLGLSELMINAIEHGNLGINYEQKTELQATGSWEKEILRRLDDPQYADRIAKLYYDKTDSQVSFRIVDQGDGFDWEKYIEPDPARAFDSHGRGISMAKMISFDSVEYHEKGNIVTGLKSLVETGT
ncbi:MAG: response regulator [Gammaproteobacteria bacterium]|nr:response regulator [Gammaproteobacteria bacterium]